MRTYLIILGDIITDTADSKFGEYVIQNKFEYWRYSPLSWILATPDDVYTNNLIAEASKCYGAVLISVIEIEIKDVGGVFPTNQADFKGWTPFQWFSIIKDPNFVPKWLQNEVTKTT